MDWDKVDNLFEQGWPLTDRERTSLLAGVEADVATTVRRLWANARQAGSFLASGSLARGRPSSHSPHQLIASRFTLIEFLGAGGMGEVFSARDEQLGRVVSLKFLNPDIASGPETRRRFEREARALCALSHPHVCVLHDLGWDGDTPFLVMEHLAGETLATRLARGPLPTLELVTIVRQLLEGLAHAHRAGVIHRDLKPGNIMLTPVGTKIFDFGIAKQMHEGRDPGASTTGIGEVAGSASYMSPEQAEGKLIDQRSDIFGFGCVLYEMIAGHKAFAGESYLSTVAAVLKEEPVPLRDLLPGAPVGLQELVDRCLRKNPTERFQSAEEVQRATERLWSDSTDGRISGARDRARVRWTPIAHGRWPIIGGTALVVVVALLLAMARIRMTKTERSVTESIAVLPFTNMANDPDLDYLADGLAESLINSLSRIAVLRVSARTTAFRYKGQDVDVRKVGRELGVQAVVMGRVSRRRGGQVRVEANLVDTSAATEIWGDQFEGNESQVLQIATALVRKLSEQVRPDSSDGTTRVVSRPATSNPDSYRLYLRGRFALSRSTVSETQSAIDFFQRALAVDPTFALAYAGLADSYIGLSGSYLKPAEAMSKAKAATLRAIELDPSLPEAHLNMGVVEGWYDFDWREAEAEFRRVAQARPNGAFGHFWLGWVLFITGRMDEGIAEAQRAHDLEPLEAFIETGVGQMYSWSGQHEMAIQRLRAVVASDPKFFNGHYSLGNAYLYAGRYAEGIRELGVARTLDDRDPRPLAYLGYGYSKSGQVAKAVDNLAELKKLRDTIFVGSYFLAVAAIASGSEKEALQWLEQAYADREDVLNVLKVDPPFQPLRANERFRAIARRVGLE